MVGPAQKVSELKVDRPQRSLRLRNPSNVWKRSIAAGSNPLLLSDKAGIEVYLPHLAKHVYQNLFEALDRGCSYPLRRQFAVATARPVRPPEVLAGSVQAWPGKRMPLATISP